MSATHRQISIAKHRLWANRWLRHWGWCLLWAATAWILLVVADRLLALRWPMGWAAAGSAAMTVLVSLLSLSLTREGDAAAALVLDHSAGLKERLSTSLLVEQSRSDPFARAVVADAEHAVAGLSARQFIPIRWAGSLSLGAMMLVGAALSLLLPEFDLLGRREALAEAESRRTALQAVRMQVANPVSTIQKISEEHKGALSDQEVTALKDSLDRGEEPDRIRRDTIKKLDRLEDALKNKLSGERLQAFEETKKRLGQVGQPADPKSELSALMEGLSSGNFDKAQEAVKKLQEELARRARDGQATPAQLEQMRRQLDGLADQLKKAAEDQQTSRELKNMGLSEADVKRVLETLAKKDLRQLEKLGQELAQRLKDKGFTEQDLSRMMEKMRQREAARQAVRQLAEKMSNAGRQMKESDTEAAQDELGQAAEMLSEMEQMEQSLNDLEGQLAELDQARDELSEGAEGSESCGTCSGTGFRKDGAPCAECNGTGRCGGRGRGAGPRDRDDNVQAGFRDEKVKGRSGRGGSIVGQQFVKGQQLRNRSQAEIAEAARAAEIDATDALERENIPRVYRRAVRNYFDRLGDQFGDTPQETPAGPAGTPPARPERTP